MEANAAILWIRDGVLVDRMHINPVAFAFAAWTFSTSNGNGTTPESLINFGFEKSGVSCLEKLQMYNEEREHFVEDVAGAAAYYNVIAAEAASNAEYFPGVIELLSDLQLSGAHNFITSAVEQEALDVWSSTDQGTSISPYLKEILGRRENFSKGKDHFEYVRKNLGIQKIYYVADATAEIRTGNEFRRDYDIVPVGFGYVITVDRVMEATKVICKKNDPENEFQVDMSKIQLPGENEIATGLRNAGAEKVVSGDRNSIIANLRQFFAV